MVHVAKQRNPCRCLLDGAEVAHIGPFLQSWKGQDDLVPLDDNRGKAFIGLFLRGMGFTFDDRGGRSDASPTAEMQRLIAANPRCREVVLPYIGGDEVNTRATHDPQRWLIHFASRSEDECRERWPELMELVERRVRPARERLDGSSADRSHRQRWWLLANERPELYAAIRGLKRVLARSLTSKHAALCFLPSHLAFDQTLVVFAFDQDAAFAVLSSAVHTLWAEAQGATFEDRPRYNVARCFDPFPFPHGWQGSRALDAAGRLCHDFRAAHMQRVGEGLTRTYNRFHDPTERGPAILQLRALHDTMDRAMLDAYGWTDVPCHRSFLPVAGTENTLTGTGPTAVRLRWPDAVTNEVLGRLLALHRERAGASPTSGSHPCDNRNGSLQPLA